ncbi:MAG: polymerase sigma factor RpoE [Labilithrix sp.]|nr:polymerase sigma factor RpoE [Labilithrix sp.]
MRGHGSLFAVVTLPPAAKELPAPVGSESARNALRFRELVEVHSPFLWQSLRRLGVPEAALDDAIQQVFLVAAGRLDAIPPGAERAFLFRTAMNISAHRRRRLARKPERPLEDDDVQTLTDPAPSADDLLDRGYARRILDEILDAMPEDLRVVFVLHEFEELSAREIAEYVGVPVGTATSRLRRAREEFHQLAARKVKEK